MLHFVSFEDSPFIDGVISPLSRESWTPLERSWYLVLSAPMLTDFVAQYLRDPDLKGDAEYQKLYSHTTPPF